MRQELQILYEDPDIIVCFKPHGLATQSHRISTPDLEHMILNHLAETEHRSSSHKHRSAPYLAARIRYSGICQESKGCPESEPSVNK